MVCVYALEDFCGRVAPRQYIRLYPNRRQSGHKLFKNLYNRLGETGSFHPKSNQGQPKVIPVELKKEILTYVTENPQIRMRRLYSAIMLRKSSIHRIKHVFLLFHTRTTVNPN